MFSRKVTAPLVPARAATPPPVNARDPTIKIILRRSPASGQYPAVQADVFAALRAKLARIPPTTPWAIDGHPLSLYSGNPATFFDPTDLQWAGKLFEDVTDIIPGCVRSFDVDEISRLLNRGPKGLDGFLQFFDYFLQIGFPVIDIIYPVHLAAAPLAIHTIEPRPPCLGLRIVFPAGKNAHTSYPFGLHAAGDLRWGYHSIGHAFYLRANTCRTRLEDGEGECSKCKALPITESRLAGILSRIENGVHENSPLMYHPVSGLVTIAHRRAEEARNTRLVKLNDTRTIGRKMAAIDDHKELTMAIATGKMARVGNIFEAGLANGAGVRGLLGLCLRAQAKKYNAAHDAASRSIGMLLFRLGGAQIAEIGHRALGLPSVSTLRRHTVIRPLLPSAGMPTVAEIEANIDSCFDATPEFSMTEPQATSEHGHKVPLELNSEADLEVLCDGLKNGDAHLAGEATVAALGALSENPREYSARPILFSADCKKESGPEHAKNILQPLVSAINNKLQRGATRFRLICVASDGESRRGTAFVGEYMKKRLASSSPIFAHLHGLEFMDLLVGDDDITADKDPKHGFKCLRNLLMRDAGVEVHGFLITVPILRAHLLANGISSRTVNAYLNPNDKQDVGLAFSLLRAIWSLPPAPADSTPQFVAAQDALRVFGKLAYHIVMPYICIDMDLSAQLTHLSTAAHLLLDLYLYNDARTRFIPNQTYANLMIMIKNVFFCVAKTKVDIPDGKFWIILLGTDRLETFFGLIRTAIGTDTNVDLLQLASRGTHTTEVQVILAMNPEWDKPPRRLKLAAVTSSGDIDPNVDHINPASCTGDLRVSQAIPLTCWRRGRTVAEGIIPGSAQRLMVNPGKQHVLPDDFPTVEEPEDDPEPYRCQKLEEEFPAAQEQVPAEAESSYLGDGDLEDAIAVEEPRGIVESEASVLGLPCLRIDNPIATLVRCEDQLFLAIGSVNGLHLGSQSLDELNTSLLADASAEVSFQIMCLARTNTDDDPTQRHDWLWSREMDGSSLRAPGCLVQPLNPTLSTRGVKPTYLFDTSELLIVAASLHEQILPRARSARQIPVVKQPKQFPYRVAGKACFLCEGDENPRNLEEDHAAYCPDCNPAAPLDLSKGQRVLEHVAAHQLHDKAMNPSHERCGLCNRPAPACMFFLAKGRGAGASYTIDWERSTCAREVHFQYSIAATSKTDGKTPSPCSNVPVICPTCGPKKPAIWKYNLASHFRNFHFLENPATWPLDAKVSDTEKSALAVVWKHIQEPPKVKKVRRRRKAMKISEAHSTRLALRTELEPYADDSERSETEPGAASVDGFDMHPAQVSDSEEDSNSVKSCRANDGPFLPPRSQMATTRSQLAGLQNDRDAKTSVLRATMVRFLLGLSPPLLPIQLQSSSMLGTRTHQIYLPNQRRHQM
ncbi:hypothetical protein C8R46DRAFT_1029251 [Mycena filopes]|nr:hypothetical protein C8R46DRAFT_1029251 [Mycena filopes]